VISKTITWGVTICSQQHWEVSRVLRGGEINLTFRRNFESHERVEWDELERELEGIEQSNEKVMRRIQ
jgi:hypothetical protein